MARAQQPSSVGSFPERPVTVDTRGAGLGNARHAELLSAGQVPQGGQRPDPISWLRGLGGPQADPQTAWTGLTTGYGIATDMVDGLAQHAANGVAIDGIPDAARAGGLANKMNLLGHAFTGFDHGLQIGDAIKHHDGESAVDDAAVQIAGLAGAMAGMFAGGEAGAWLGGAAGTALAPGPGSAAGAVGGALLGALGGAVGGYFGEQGAEALTSWTIHSFWGDEAAPTVDAMPSTAADLADLPTCLRP